MRITAYRWGAAGEPWCAMVIAHGAAEHALRYDRFARAIGEAGIEDVGGRPPGPWGVGGDPKGSGTSARAAGDALVADIGQLVRVVRGRRPGTPVVLLGHSMGGGGGAAVRTRWVGGDSMPESLPGSTAREAPREGEELPAFEPNKGFEPARTAYDWLSCDEAEVDKYVADPLCGFETQGSRRGRAGQTRSYWRTGSGCVESGRPAGAAGGRDADPVNNGLAGLRLLEERWRAAGVARIERRYYAGGRHEMLNETNRDEVTADIVGWVKGVV